MVTEKEVQRARKCPKHGNVFYGYAKDCPGCIAEKAANTRTRDHQKEGGGSYT